MKKEEMEKSLKLCRKTALGQALSRPAICLTAFMAKVRVRPMATPAIRQGLVVGKEAAGHITGDIQALHGLVVVVQRLTLFVDGNALLGGQQRGTQPAAIEGRSADGTQR